jgi:hypothetical protein
MMLSGFADLAQSAYGADDLPAAHHESQARIDLSDAPSQERSVATNLRSLADASVWRDPAEPLALYADAELVGFALLYPLTDRAPSHPCRRTRRCAGRSSSAR